MSDIEAQRLANLKYKDKLLADLNISGRVTRVSKAQTTKIEDGTTTKRRKVMIGVAPTRASARLQQIDTRPSYMGDDDGGRFTERIKATPKQRSKRQKAPPIVDDEELEATPGIETIRESWSKWEPTGEAPSRDEEGSFHFEDFPLFLPNKSPEEMIREGCFGGSYWRVLKSRQLGIVIQEDWTELPSSWIEGLDVHRFLTNPDYDTDVNKYKVACGQSIEEWEASGWIMHKYDVRGWFQWYCRFFQGRRCSDDDRQVSRWRKCVGATGRWKRMLLKAYMKMGVRFVFDDGEDEDSKEVSPVMHQTCHHWAYEIKQHDLDDIWNE